jgi:hypothetical protein
VGVQKYIKHILQGYCFFEEDIKGLRKRELELREKTFEGDSLLH